MNTKIPDIPTSKRYSKQIKAEANELLNVTGITKLLEEFGVVEHGGSFEYDLMVDRDLDFGVQVESITPGLRARIASTFAAQDWVYGLKMVDRANFDPLSHLGAPLGLFLGLTIPFPKDRWNIDVWFISGEIVKSKTTNLVAGANPEQRQKILDIKYELMKSGQAIKGVTSAKVYDAVIKHNIYSTLEFTGWLNK